jgi:large subunit ribosomal protein L21
VDKLQADKSYQSTDILAIFGEDGTSVSVGAPFVKGASITFDISTHQKGDKLHVYKFKNKNRYSRKIGFRPHQTVLYVKEIIHGT